MIFARAGVVLSGVLLALGLALHVAGTDGLSGSLLAAGLIVLMITPVTRIAVALADWVKAGDRQFAVVTLMVVVELFVALWLATQRI